MTLFTPKTISQETELHVRLVNRYLRASYPSHPARCAFRFDEEEARVIISDLRERKTKRPLSPLFGLQKKQQQIAPPPLKNCPKPDTADTLKKGSQRGELSRMPSLERTGNLERRQLKVLQSLEKHLGIVSIACKAARVSRSQFYHWKATSPDFARQVEEIREIALDYVESKLFELIAEGSSTAIIFYLKTKGRKHGYC